MTSKFAPCTDCINVYFNKYGRFYKKNTRSAKAKCWLWLSDIVRLSTLIRSKSFFKDYLSGEFACEGQEKKDNRLPWSLGSFSFGWLPFLDLQRERMRKYEFSGSRSVVWWLRGIAVTIVVHHTVWYNGKYCVFTEFSMKKWMPVKKPKSKYFDIL